MTASAARRAASRVDAGERRTGQRDRLQDRRRRDHRVVVERDVARVVVAERKILRPAAVWILGRQQVVDPGQHRRLRALVAGGGGHPSEKLDLPRRRAIVDGRVVERAIGRETRAIGVRQRLRHVEVFGPAAGVPLIEAHVLGNPQRFGCGQPRRWLARDLVPRQCGRALRASDGGAGRPRQRRRVGANGRRVRGDATRVPAVVAAKHHLGRQVRELGWRCDARPGDARSDAAARAAGARFEITNGLLTLGPVPVVPARRAHHLAHRRIDECHVRERPPRATEVRAGAGFATDDAVQEHEAESLLRGRGRGREVAVTPGAKMASLEHRRRSAENEIDVPADERVLEVVASTVEEDRVLPAQQAAVPHRDAIAVHAQGQRLTDRPCRSSRW